ncbi:response regulator [Aliikangiella sp. G2MR2-5]|uniref:response regulator n=1 Tax=Aliikangiella sp. G2MR2-5 TaxID=2788943 RepID=UPI0018A999B3|nr:response regulator [Aliikangiella sp. G2MR2-5]
MAHRIFIVEDEKEIASVVEMYLNADGFETQVFHEGTNVTEAIKHSRPSVVLLDLMLPQKDGVTICKEVREFSDVPIIMTTAKVEEVDRLLGLEIGADDYVCKPYSVKELVARVKAVTRRLDNKVSQSSPEMVVNADNHTIQFRGQTISLTTVEFNLFHLLYTNPNRIYSRQQILDQVYSDYRVISDRTVDSHIRNLRKKLAELETPEEPVRSIYGAGYKYEPWY